MVSAHRQAFENKLIGRILVVTIILVTIGLILTLLPGGTPLMRYGLLGFFLLYGSLLWLHARGRWRSRYNLPYVALNYVTTLFSWFLAGGATTAATFAFSMITVLALLVTPPRTRLLVAILYCGTFTLLIALELSGRFSGLLAPTAEAKRIALPFAVVLNMGLVFVVFHVKNYFDAERLAVARQQRELVEKNALIEAQNMEIKAINERLDEHVRERTARLAAQNKRLADYAFANSHLLRAPVARLLGLTDILLNLPPDPPDPHMVGHVRDAALQVDEVVRQINDQVSETDTDDLLPPTRNPRK